MGLISASSLGQPIIRVNYSTSKRPVVSSLNVLPRGRSPLKTAATMAPALTTESSAEHRKRSLSSELCSVVNKLDPSSGDGIAAAEPAGPSKGPSPPPPTQTLTNSDEEAAALKAADEVLGPNVDEILQVLESIESSDKCGGGSTSAEDSMLQRLLGSADLDLLAGAICGSQEQDADVAEVVTSPVPSPTPKVEERVAEASERQHVLERRCERLLRRVRKMQARGTSRHAAHQMQDLVTSARALLKARNASHRSHAASQQQATKEQLLDTENVKNMSATALVNLVRKISSSSSPAKPVSQGLAQALSPDQASNLRAGASSLSFRLHHTEAALDSDVTASSSGGESCDEAVGYNPNHTGTLPICKRAAWRFAKERASVVSRWTWLQANIADLEYRIRQYTECHRSIRLNKGAVRLELPVAPAKPPQGEESMVMNGCHMEPPVPLEEQACARTRPLDTSTYRRRKIVAPGVLIPIYDQKAENAVVRTLPTHNQPPCCRDSQSLAMPCILCFKKRSGVTSAGGSGPPPPPRDPIARESCKERVARLDPALHPVMSGLSDVSRALHMAAHLRQSSWQQSQLRHRGLAKLGLGLKRHKAAHAGQLGQGTVELLTSPSQQTPRRKYNVHKKNNNNANSTALSAKIRRKAKNRKRHRGRPAAADGPDAFVERYRRNSRKLQRLSSEAMPNLTAEGDAAERPIPAPSPSVVSESRAPRRKREDSYDIDNIVIPYSMAALTRVERLEYKEILTPKWRMVEADLVKASSLTSAKSGLGKNGVVKPSNSTPPSPDSEVEDISDEAVTARHDALEMEERRKFRCPPSTRGLRGRRTDSRAESSGANTPDPMSPNPVTAEVGDSPMASPRATPLPPAMLQEDSQGSKPGGSKPLASGSKQPSIGLRRRTVSSQRASPEPSTPFYEIAPFEARMFPLQEEVFQRMLAGSNHSPPMPTLAPVLSPESRTDRRRSSVQESSTRTPRTLPSPPPSPCDTDSTESALPEDDDMDPEWTLDSEMVPSPQSASSSSAVRPFRRSQ